MAATNLSQIDAGLAAAFALINGSGDYNLDLTAPGAVRYERPITVDTLQSPSLVYWFGEVTDVRDGPYADLSQYGQRMEWFLLGKVALASDRDDNLVNGWNLEADIRRALHLSRTLPVGGSGTIFDLTYNTRVVTGEDMGVAADSVYVQGGGSFIWARF